MIQNIIVLIIVGVVAVKIIYSVYRSVTIKDKSLCGGCASCELKKELKKKGKLRPYYETRQKQEIQVSPEKLRYVPGS